ncbi:MAG: 3-deoxy-D-manno-octulosonate 8-phosphate phosphatase (KDO 8-P phosphatase) [Halieaceae bacterium]|jgi:3-deoxy-D-manno-octulosonate 8-phosphate phosphatase (KDO 8-P phosphatase)
MILDRAADIKILALDVDGILSDGKLYMSNAGEEIKTFNVRDGLGLKLLQSSGVAVAIITGRRSQIVANRAKELGIEHVIQGQQDKLKALSALCDSMSLSLASAAYMGDDLPDLSAIEACRLGMTVADAHPMVIQGADWVSERIGGNGAVRDACELIMNSQGTFSAALAGMR